MSTHTNTQITTTHFSLTIKQFYTQITQLRPKFHLQCINTTIISRHTKYVKTYNIFNISIIIIKYNKPCHENHMTKQQNIRMFGCPSAILFQAKITRPNIFQLNKNRFHCITNSKHKFNQTNNNK